MKPLWFVIAAVILGGLGVLVLRGRRVGRLQLAIALLVVAGCIVYGSGAVELPNIEEALTSIGRTLGPWTYLLVGVLAFLETGAFVGLIAPGETAIMVGGVVAGQGEIDIIALIAIVWVAAIAGDLTSYLLGRRLGRAFLVKHGPKVQITPERLEVVETFFEKHGGKAILIGRFVGLVRAIAPFLAGSSKMPLRRFVPYDVLGAGLWATTFSLLGFFFWRSLDQLLTIAKQGAFALGTVITVVVAIVVAVRWLRVDENRHRLRVWIDEQERRPVIGPLVRVGHRFADWLRGPVRFLWNRLTPGQLGLELTALLAVLAVGSFTFFGYLIVLDRGTVQTVGDQRVVGWVLDLRTQTGIDVARVVSALGSFPAIAIAVVAAAAWCLARRRIVDALIVLTGTVLSDLAMRLAKALVDRPRPWIATYDPIGSSYPSGHATHMAVYLAAALILTRTGSQRARIAAVIAAVVVALVVGASRLYLGVHYLSDVLGGYGLGASIFAIVGIVALVATYLRQNPRTA